jgi:hypothetical protein
MTPTKEEPKAARGTSADAEPERPEATDSDADLIDEGEEAKADLAASYELPDDQKAVQMTPEEYASMGPGAKEVPATAEPGAKPASEDRASSSTQPAHKTPGASDKG